MTKNLTISTILLLITLACSLSPDFLAEPPADSPTDSPAVSGTDTPILPPPTESPATPIPSTATPTPAATPTPVEAAISPTPEVDFENLAPYRQAMLPEFVDDVETVAQAGASHYFIDLTFDSETFTNGEDLTFSGVQRVLYTNTEDIPLSEIYFRLFANLFGGDITVDSVVVNGQPVEATLEAGNSALRVPLVKELQPDEQIDLTLTYTITVPSGKQNGYNIFSYSNGTAALATFYPVIAVFDNQGWNIDIPVPYGDATYLDTSLYQVQVTVPEAMVVTASGSLIESVSNNGDTKTLHLASGPMRDFYLAMRKDFEVMSEVVDGTVVNSYFPPGKENGGKLALRYAADALAIFNQRFGQYPFAEFDVVATPTTAGGVEYPGIVVVSERIYNQQGGFFEHATAHEVAHQWWYSLVGNNQLTEPWLDEALTNYSAIIYWEETGGPQSAEFVLENFMQEPYEQARKEGRDKAVLGPVSDFSQEEYSTFVYGKGALFFEALRQDVGDELYFEIMKQYYANNKYGLANANTLFETIEQVTGKNIDPLLETWLQSP